MAESIVSECIGCGSTLGTYACRDGVIGKSVLELDHATTARVCTIVRKVAVNGQVVAGFRNLREARGRSVERVEQLCNVAV